MGNTDKNWTKWGEENPYFGVLTEEKFLSKNLKKNKREFFDNGKEFSTHLLHAIEMHAGSFKPKTIVDFGCGVGRVTIPIAELTKCKSILGLDIAPGMLNEAQKNVPKNAKNIHFALSDDNLTKLPDTYDFVYSTIVFQHMAIARGYSITEKLLKNLANNGVAALHYTTHDDSSASLKFIRATRKRIPIIGKLINVYKRRPFDTPIIEMNMYKLSRLIQLFYDNGITDVRCITNHPDCYYGTLIIGRKVS